MKNFKKVTAMLMGATFIMSASFMTFAENNNRLNSETSVNEVLDMSISNEAVIKSIDKNDGNTQILITTNEANPMDIMLNLSNDTKVDLGSLNIGDTVNVKYSKAMTRSIPPQSAAFEIEKIDSNNSNPEASLPIENGLPSAMTLNAVIGEITDGNYKSILVNDSQNSQIALNLDSNTAILKVDGTEIGISELKAGDRVTVLHSPAMTFSLPPQTYAYAIILSDEQIAAPKLVKTASVDTDETGVTVVTSEDGEYIVRINDETQISQYRTKNIVKASDIKEGTTFLFWSDIITASLPAQATAKKILILPQIESENDENLDRDSKVTDLNQIVINGETLNLETKPIQIIDGYTMVPLRQIAEKLGFQVQWNSENSSVELDRGTVKSSLKLGEDSYSVQFGKQLDTTTPQSLGIAPLSLDGNVYIPTEFFDVIAENTVSVVDGILNIN